VYTEIMKNITLSADEGLIEKARARAAAQQTTLNSLFRNWLAEYAEPRTRTREELDAFLDKYSYFRVGKMPTREERNER
jgi:hypothetical protein